MTGLLLAAVIAPASYKFDAATKQNFKLEAVFEGFLPILGGNEGKAEIMMGVAVKGQSPDEAKLKASNEITAFELKFNGAKLPFGLESVQDYFPKTNIVIQPTGKIVKTDAPDKTLPVRLPGLDIKRFPDITYVPIELPDGTLAVGSKWNFKKNFGGEDINYTCEATKVSETAAEIAVNITQEYEVMENEGLEIVTKEADAVAKVKTTMVGTGKVYFNLTLGLPDHVIMKNDSTSTVTQVKSGEKSTRKLVTTFKVTRDGAAKIDGLVVKAKATVPPKDLAGAASMVWDSTVKFGQDLWVGANQKLQLAKMLAFVLWQNIPGLGSKFMNWLAIK